MLWLLFCPPQPMSLADDVLDRLRRSITDHLAALALRHRFLPLAKETLQRAYELRKDAHALDPAMTAPAWQLERDRFYPTIDQALMAFYLAKLGP